MKTKDATQKEIKNFNAQIERRFKKANKALIASNGGKIRGCLSEVRAAAARKRNEMYARKKTVTIRVHESARDAMDAAGITDKPMFASDAIFARIRSGEK